MPILMYVRIPISYVYPWGDSISLNLPIILFTSFLTSCQWKGDTKMSKALS